MNRRQFLQAMSALSAVAAGSAPVVSLSQLARAQASPAPNLVVGEGKDIKALMVKVLEPLGGMKAFVKKGQNVVVKPNIGWDRAPEQAANTNPQVVQALVLLALEAGAAKVMVFDRTCNSAQRTYENSGILRAVKDINDDRASCTFIDDRKFVKMQIAKGKALQEWSFYKDALEADVYINVPIAKHHGISKLTLGLKNVMGVIGGNRGQIHKNIGQNLADLATVLKPHLTVMDATRILTRNGPSGGDLAHVKELDTLMATADPVAADAYATTLFGLKPSDIPTTVAAFEAGLGEMDLEKIKVAKV